MLQVLVTLWGRLRCREQSPPPRAVYELGWLGGLRWFGSSSLPELPEGSVLSAEGLTNVCWCWRNVVAAACVAW